MNPREEGFLLLTSRLGDPARKVLTVAQLRSLAMRIRSIRHQDDDRMLTQQDLLAAGCGREEARQILALLSQEQALHSYLSQGKLYGCTALTRASDDYPAIIRQRLGLDSPGCLWLKGDASILQMPAVSLVGSRELREPNREFARAVGYQAAVQGLPLVSGNARGADRTAQDSCLAAGGRVISVVADELWKQPERRNVLYISEEGYDEAFSAQRALSRNRCIHALGLIVFVAQASLHKGGTWGGTVRNLRFGWSMVACFRDGSQSALELEQLGAYLIDMEDLEQFRALPEQQSFL